MDGGADRAGEVLGRVHLAPAQAEAGGERVAGDGGDPAVGLGDRGRAAASRLACGGGGRGLGPGAAVWAAVWAALRLAPTMRVLASRAMSREERAPARFAARSDGGGVFGDTECGRVRHVLHGSRLGQLARAGVTGDEATGDGRGEQTQRGRRTVDPAKAWLPAGAGRSIGFWARKTYLSVTEGEPSA